MSTRKPPFKKPAKTAEVLGPTWFFGFHAVAEALKNPARHANRMVVTRNAARELGDNLPPPGGKLVPEILEPKKISQILPEGSVHQGVGLMVEPLPEPRLEKVCANPDPAQPIIVLDQVTDPHNVGAIMRTASAFGARALVTTRRHSPELTGTLAKVASGAVEHLPYVRITNLSEALRELNDLGYQTLGLAEEGEQTLAQIQPLGPVALVMGAEGKGLRQKTRETCDALVKLPTQGAIGSLNVSNAAAVALYEVARK